MSHADLGPRRPEPENLRDAHVDVVAPLAPQRGRSDQVHLVEGPGERPTERLRTRRNPRIGHRVVRPQGVARECSPMSPPAARLLSGTIYDASPRKSVR